MHELHHYDEIFINLYNSAKEHSLPFIAYNITQVL